MSGTLSLSPFFIYIYIFRLGPRPSSILERATKNILGRSFARGRDASRCYLLDRGGGGGFSLIRGRLEDSTVGTIEARSKRVAPR